MNIYNLKLNKFTILKLFFCILTISILLVLLIEIIKVFKLSKSSNDINYSSEIKYIDESSYTNILKSVHDNMNDFIGKKINFTGYIYRVYDFNEDEFVLARDMIIGSNNQSVVVGFMCQFKDINKFPEGSWINVTGEITKGSYHGDIPIIKVLEIKNCSQPENLYVYPPNENYLQTNDI